jgi:hypothetical protein
MIILTFWDKLSIFMGYPYLMNKNTMEVHDLRKLTKSCSVGQMADHNKRRISHSQFEKAITKGYKGRRANGCRWCLKKHDTG